MMLYKFTPILYSTKPVLGHRMSIKEDLMFTKAIHDQEWIRKEMETLSDNEALRYLNTLLEEATAIIDDHTQKHTSSYKEFD